MLALKKFIFFLIATFSISNISAQITNPIPQLVQNGPITLRLVDWIQVPDSDGQAAAINLAYHSRDDSDRLFVNDQRGYLYVIHDDAISLYLHLNAILTNAIAESIFGTGFHAFTFHPDFANNGKFYTVHMESWSSGVPDLLQTESGSVSRHNVITEWTTQNPKAMVFSGTHREILRVEEPRIIHHMQEIGFNPNSQIGDPDYGMLYVANGDGGVLNTNRPQSLNSPHGSILRIDPLGNNSASGRYGIPADNPFVGDQNVNTLDEIWAYGFRNPSRFSWDTGGTQKMLISDIGEKNIEEINLGEAGQNYGWNNREGTFAFNKSNNTVVFPLPADDAQNNYRYPVAQYDHDDGLAVAGGFVYRGSLIPELFGHYVFGDIVNGHIFHVAVDDLIQGQQATLQQIALVGANDAPTSIRSVLNSSRADVRFGITQQQEIVILSKTDGKIRRLESLIAPDSDIDGVPDNIDNCLNVANTDQRDTDLDGFGNICDADINNDNIVNFGDVAIIAAVFLSDFEHADFNGDNVVNFADLFILTEAFLSPPGP